MKFPFHLGCYHHRTVTLYSHKKVHTIKLFLITLTLHGSSLKSICHYYSTMKHSLQLFKSFSQSNSAILPSYLFQYYLLSSKPPLKMLQEKYVSNLCVFYVLSSRTAISCLLYTSPSPRDRHRSRMPSSA